jgi:hypothetical protein
MAPRSLALGAYPRHLAVSAAVLFVCSGGRGGGSMSVSIGALTAGILAVSISTFSLVPVCAAEGLNGAQRTSFVKGSYESCMKSWAANPDSSSLPADIGGKFCTCSANRHADKTSPSDLKSLNEQTIRDPAAMVIKLQPLMKEISDYCVERVMSDTKQ